MLKVVVISDPDFKKALTAQGVQVNIDVQYLNAIPSLSAADCYIDLLFVNTRERIKQLRNLAPALIIVNAVSTTLKELPENFIRINGWAGFLNRSLIEAACEKSELKSFAEKIFAGFNKNTEWVTDKPGFITATVVSMIINEAYFALDEGVSSKDEIDIALKLGTNYPFGPFEWAEKIGLHRVDELLCALAVLNPRYQPASLLQKEATDKL